MVDGPLRLVLVVRDVKRQELYLGAIRDLGVSCDVVDDVSTLADALVHTPCNGLLLDVLCTVRCSEGEKAFVHDLLEIYPMLRMRCNPGTGEINSLMYGSGERISISEFVDRHCRSFRARRLRTSARVYNHSRILVAADVPFDTEQAQRSVTINLSAEGCFIYTIGPGRQGERCWVVFPDFRDRTPIEVETRWAQAWGPGGAMPGIGVRFVRMSSDQQQEIGELTGRRRSPS